MTWSLSPPPCFPCSLSRTIHYVTTGKKKNYSKNSTPPISSSLHFPLAGTNWDPGGDDDAADDAPLLVGTYGLAPLAAPLSTTTPAPPPPPPSTWMDTPLTPPAGSVKLMARFLEKPADPPPSTAAPQVVPEVALVVDHVVLLRVNGMWMDGRDGIISLRRVLVGWGGGVGGRGARAWGGVFFFRLCRPVPLPPLLPQHTASATVAADTSRVAVFLEKERRAA